MSAQTGRDSGIPGTAGQAGKTANKEEVVSGALVIVGEGGGRPYASAGQPEARAGLAVRTKPQYQSAAWSLSFCAWYCRPSAVSRSTVSMWRPGHAGQSAVPCHHRCAWVRGCSFR